MGNGPQGGDGPGGRPGPDEVWDTSLIGDDFVEGAMIEEPTAEERVAERRRLDAERWVLDEIANEEEARLASVRRLRLRRLRAAIAALVVASLFAGAAASLVRARATADLADDEPPRTTDRSRRSAATIASQRPYEFRVTTTAYERVAADGGRRDLETQVYTPIGSGPFPVIAFAHGFAGHPRKFQELFSSWARRGYAVVAPRFPKSADDANPVLAEAAADSREQPADLEFALRSALDDDARSATARGGRPALDASQVALAGLSLGGATVLSAAYTDCCPTVTPKVVIALSPVPVTAATTPDGPPLLLVHGTADATLPYDGSVRLFEDSSVRRWFVTLDGGNHAAPYEDEVSPYDGLVQELTGDVLDRYLLGDTRGLDRAEDAIDDDPGASLATAA